MVSLKSVEQAGRLEIEVRVDVAALSPRSAGWKLRQGFCVTVLRQNSFFGNSKSLLLRQRL